MLSFGWNCELLADISRLGLNLSCQIELRLKAGLGLDKSRAQRHCCPKNSLAGLLSHTEIFKILIGWALCWLIAAVFMAAAGENKNKATLVGDWRVVCRKMSS